MVPDFPTITKARSAVARDVKAGRDATESRRQLAEANLAAYVARIVENAPPLTAEQRDRIAGLLRSGAA